MRILVNIGHPAHVHFFKNFIWQMKARGHGILISAVAKDVAVNLLDSYGFDYDLYGSHAGSISGLVKELVMRDAHIYKLARKLKPDLIVGIGDLFGAHVSRVTKAKSVVFTDTEHATLANLVTFPFADVICTPSCFKKDLGRKQVRYNGYHELAYLHPNYFTPDPSVLSELGLTESDKFVIVRFVAWQASHDAGQHGFDSRSKRKLVEELGNYARVLITSESSLPDEFEQYRITTPPERIHDLLYYATLYVGEGATMASECAVLGTPAIYANTSRLGYLDEEEDEYGLVYNFSDPHVAQEQAIGKAIELLQRDHLKEESLSKRERLLSDKIDVTPLMVDFIENYPESFEDYRNNQAKVRAGK